MALIDFTGFDGHTDNALPDYFFSYSPDNVSYFDSTANTRFENGKAFYCSNATSGCSLWKFFNSDLSSLIVGFAAKAVTTNSIYTPYFQFTFGNYDYDYQTSIRHGYNDFIVGVYRGSSSSGTLLANANNQISVFNWNFYEIKVTLGNGTGSCIVRVNGVEIINISSIDNINTGSDTTINRFGFHGINFSFYLDDMYILDETGSQNNDFLGDVTVDTLLPSANGTTNDGTASTGSNYECVDALPYSDIDYVTLDAINEIELYTMEDLPSTSYTKTIYGVRSKFRSSKDSTGARAMLPIVRINSSNYEHSDDDIYLSSSFGYNSNNYIWELNPDDSAAWEESDINSMESGIKITV